MIKSKENHDYFFSYNFLSSWQIHFECLKSVTDALQSAVIFFIWFNYYHYWLFFVFIFRFLSAENVKIYIYMRKFEIDSFLFVLLSFVAFVYQIHVKSQQSCQLLCLLVFSCLYGCNGHVIFRAPDVTHSFVGVFFYMLTDLFPYLQCLQRVDL